MHPFPCPTTYKTALTWYVDLTSCPRTNVLKELSGYASDEKDREFLLSMTKVSKEAKVNVVQAFLCTLICFKIIKFLSLLN